MVTADPWTPEDLSRLFLAFQRGTAAVLAEFPGRTLKACRDAYLRLESDPALITKGPSNAQIEELKNRIESHTHSGYEKLLAKQEIDEAAVLVVPSQPEPLPLPAALNHPQGRMPHVTSNRGAPIPWTDEDDEKLVEVFAQKGVSGLEGLFPYRSMLACKQRIGVLRQRGVEIPYQRAPRALRAAPLVDEMVEERLKRAERLKPERVREAVAQIARQMDDIPPFDITQKGITQYVQRPEFGENYEYIRRRLLWTFQKLGEELGVPTAGAARAAQVMGAFDFRQKVNPPPPIARLSLQKDPEGS